MFVIVPNAEGDNNVDFSRRDGVVSGRQIRFCRFVCEALNFFRRCFFILS